MLANSICVFLDNGTSETLSKPVSAASKSISSCVIRFSSPSFFLLIGWQGTAESQRVTSKPTQIPKNATADELIQVAQHYVLHKYLKCSMELQHLITAVKNLQHLVHTLAVASFSARIASLSACLTMTDVLVDFRMAFSASSSSGISACVDELGLSADLSAFVPSSGFGVAFFFLTLVFLSVLPGNISRFLIGNLFDS